VYPDSLKRFENQQAKSASDADSIAAQAEAHSLQEQDPARRKTMEDEIRVRTLHLSPNSGPRQ
jgi:hypothetical protein